MNKLEQLRQKRFQFLHRLYGMSGGNRYRRADMREIGQHLGFTLQETEIIAQYLEGERLIEYPI